jgi:hypothetical protein
MDEKQLAARMRQVAEIIDNGETLQWQIYGPAWIDWRDSCDSLSRRLSDTQYKFRAKPREPRELWVNIYESSTICHCHGSQELAEKNKGKGDVETIHMREVMPEEG